MQATIALMKDGTIAVEVSTSLTLLQWPFLTDISLAWAAASIFDPNLVDNDAPEGMTPNELDAILASTEASPWLYFNCILRDSQIFIPVADPVRLVPPVTGLLLPRQMPIYVPNLAGPNRNQAYNYIIPLLP